MNDSAPEHNVLVSVRLSQRDAKALKRMAANLGVRPAIMARMVIKAQLDPLGSEAEWVRLRIEELTRGDRERKKASVSNLPEDLSKQPRRRAPDRHD